VVTLVGIVRCDTTEKRVLEQIARQAFEVTEVVNLRRVGH
jgi:osmotically-inducible protein OsmY